MDLTRRYLTASREAHAEAVRLAAIIAELEAHVRELEAANAELRQELREDSRARCSECGACCCDGSC